MCQCVKVAYILPDPLESSFSHFPDQLSKQLVTKLEIDFVLGQEHFWLKDRFAHAHLLTDFHQLASLFQICHKYTFGLFLVMQFYNDTDTANGANMSIENCTLIVPCVSVGNVAQLSCDLLINTLELQKIGHLHTECVLPIIGSSPFDSNKANSVTLSLELYYNEGKQLAVLQQRAPTVPGKLSQFAKELMAWISNQNVAHVIMLTSCHAYERLDDEIRNSKVLFVAEENLHRQLIDQGMTPLNQRKDEFGSASYFMPGSGIAKPFHDLCLTEAPKFAYALFMIFCSEGDNVPEAVELLNAVNGWQGYIEINNRKKLNWKVPASWKQMFGSGAPKSIF